MIFDKTLRGKIAWIIWNEDTGDISDSEEHYLQVADYIIQLVKERIKSK